MLRRLMILNVGLAALLVAGGMKLRRDWKAFGPAHNIAAIQPRPHTYPPLSAGRASTGPAVDWTEIPTKDPFSFDRNDIDIVIAVVAEAPPPPPKPVGPKPILFGTMSIGKNQSALIAPGTAGNRNFHEAKIGESIDGWTIVGIGDRSIEIESDGVHQTVKTSDSATLVTRDTSRSVSNVAPVPVPVVPAAAPTAVPTASTAPPTPGAPAPPAVRPPAPPGFSYVDRGIFGVSLLPDK